jgi:hypothetical protein
MVKKEKIIIYNKHEVYKYLKENLFRAPRGKVRKVKVDELNSKIIAATEKVNFWRIKLINMEIKKGDSLKMEYTN